MPKINKRRSTRFYRKNEEEVMEALGLQPTLNSGAGWIEKEDGQNDYLIAQLKSTDKESMSIKKRDIEILEANAMIAHKVPLFVIQFLSTGDTYIMARPSDLKQVVEYINTGECQKPTDEFILETNNKPQVKKIKSSSNARDSFWDGKREENSKWKKNMLKRK